MSDLRESLRCIARDLASVPFALVGGIAVSVRCEPRFTRDVDLAVAVADDEQAESLVRRLGAEGYAAVELIEQDAAERLSTVRLQRGPDQPNIDLLFASSGIERETTEDAETLEVFPGQRVPVARVSHLIAMKLLAADAKERPQDQVDLVSLARVASSNDLATVSDLLDRITERGFHRGRDLRSLFEAWKQAAR